MVLQKIVGIMTVSKKGVCRKRQCHQCGNKQQPEPVRHPGKLVCLFPDRQRDKRKRGIPDKPDKDLREREELRVNRVYQ